MLLSFLSTVLTSLVIGILLVVIRRAFSMPRTFGVDLGLTALGAGMLLLFHLVSPDLLGFDPLYGVGFDIAKHALELLVILMMLVAL